MKNKIKKIPKYYNGGPVSGNVNWADMSANQKFSTISNIAGTTFNMVANNADKKATWGGALTAGAQGVATGATFGPIGAIVGGATGMILGGLGSEAKVDLFGNVQEASGITKYLNIGKSNSLAYAESNRKKTSIADQALTQSMNQLYYSDPNNSMNGNIYAAAAEGGIVPGEHYASRGEVEVAADGTNAVRYGWDPRGKDTFHVYTNPDGTSAEGNMIFTEEGVRRPNGEKYSDAAEKIIKSTKEGSRLRQISLRKLANEMEEQKMNKEIKKVKKGISAYEDGTDGKEFDFENSFLYRQPDGTFVMQDINGKRTPVPEMMLPYIQGDEHGYYFGPQTGIAPSAGKWNGSMNFAKLMLNLKNIQKLKNAATKVFARNAKPATVNAVKNSTQAVQAEKAMLKAERQQGTFDMWQRLGNKGGVPARTVETTVANRGPLNGNLWEYTAAQQAAANAAVEQAAYNSLTKSNLPYWLTLSGMLGGAGTFLTYEATKDGQNQSTNTATSTPVTSIGPSPVTPVSTQKTSNVTEPTVKVTDVPVVSEKKVKVADKPANKTTTVKKPDSKSTTSRATTSAVPSPEDTVVRRPVYEETVKVADTPVDATKVYGREGDVRYDYLAPERKVKPGELGRPDDTDINYNGSDWRDSLYRMAVLSQPLWGREKAEPVDYNFPVYKYMPTAIDVSSQLESADQNYALSRYNFANLYPNTGAGMAAGLQAASNRAKQYADIRQWQTNAQNELIGKNAGIYNNWSNEHARILNDVRNKYAQNRATARNINRQNMATALNNYGAMLSDDKKMNIEAQNNQLKANMLKPFIESVYENSDELIPMLAPYTMNRNVKKKSSTR